MIFSTQALFIRRKVVPGKGSLSQPSQFDMSKKLTSLTESTALLRALIVYNSAPVGRHTLLVSH